MTDNIERIMNSRRETHIPPAYMEGCSYKNNCKERVRKTSEEFEEQCLGIGQGCLRANALSTKELARGELK